MLSQDLIVWWCCVALWHIKVKVKWSHYRPGVAQRVGRGIALLFHDSGTRRGWVVSSSPGRTLPPGKTRYPFYRRLGGPQGRSGWMENLVPTRIRSRTVQPVVSRYTDWATRPTLWHIRTINSIWWLDAFCLMAWEHQCCVIHLWISPLRYAVNWCTLLGLTYLTMPKHVGMD